MENKVKVWLARDEDGRLWVYPTIPFREGDIWFYDEPITQLDSSLFPSVKWEDDKPTEAYITLAKPQEQQKKEIDWEQRRFEIAKDILATMFFQPENHSLTVEADVDFAVEVADILIEKLKGGKR